MDDVRGRFLELPHGTTPAAVTTNKNIKMSSFKSGENIQKKECGPDRFYKVKIMFIYEGTNNLVSSALLKCFSIL